MHVRNVFIRDLDEDAGFVSLFDGKTLAGWPGAVAGHHVVDGELQHEAPVYSPGTC